MDYSKSVGLNPKYNTFDLSHDKKLTMKMGEIIPVMAMDVLPGDKFNIESSHLTRFLPLVAPVMHQVKVKVRYFFSPNRLVWDNWEDFITGPESATDTTEPVHPTVRTTGVPSTLSDYMGISTFSHAAQQTVDVNALPFAHYQFIYNEYFRDQNLVDEKNYKLTDGLNGAGDLLNKRRVAWQHDRFTSSLPFTQKGPEVTLPVLSQNYDIITAENLQGGAITGNMQVGGVGPITNHLTVGGQAAQLTVKNSDLQTATINQLREAFAIQKWLELNARAGNRYTEHIQAHFGVTPQDARLQRPEEFGGSVSTVQFSEVLQTADTQDGDVGTMAGHGITASGSRNSSYYAQEHGWIFAFMYVVPDSSYFQGIPKKFDKIDRYDYYQPLLAHIGEQPVKRREIFASGVANNDNTTFGYLPIYDEYRHETNSVHGLMKTDLKHWHMSRDFGVNLPSLNNTFVSCNPTDRIFTETGDAEQIIAHVYNKINVGRKVPYYGTPMGI